MSDLAPNLSGDASLLRLDRNEGPAAGAWVLEALAGASAESVRRYPQPHDLERTLADRLGVEERRVLVTAGGDEGIDRVCRLSLGPDREALIHDPTFEMIEHFAGAVGAAIHRAPWRTGEFPVQRFVEAILPSVGMVALGFA